MIGLIISITALVISLLTSFVVYVKIKSVYLNLYNLSKGLDVLFSNQEKILELTNLKTFVQLTSNEELNVREEIKKENPRFSLSEKTEDFVRPSKSDKNNKES